MAKLYFRYGVINSAKTLNLLAVAHAYRQQKKKILIVRPALDERTPEVSSRAGLSQPPDLVVSDHCTSDQLYGMLTEKTVACVLVDECQFFTRDQIDGFRQFVRNRNIPVICYGLRTDFCTRLFEGSHRLMEVADSIEEVKTTCSVDGCTKKAIYSARIIDGKCCKDVDAPVVVLGMEETYQPVCDQCYHTRL